MYVIELLKYFLQYYKLHSRLNLEEKLYIYTNMIDVLTSTDSTKTTSIQPGSSNQIYPEVNTNFTRSYSNNEDIDLEMLANKDLLAEESEIEDDNDEDNQNFSQTNDYLDTPGFDEDQDQKPDDHGMSYEEIEREKAIYLSKLNRLLTNPNVSGRHLNSAHSLGEIKAEVFRIQKDIEVLNGLNYSKQGLMFCVNTLEMLSKGFTENLDGWSQVMMNDINNHNYDQVLEELYEKYSKHVTAGPEVRLIFMIASSAFMFSLQKALVEKSLNGGKKGESFLESLMSKFRGSEKPQNVNDISGPSFNVDDLSDVSSVSSVEIEPELPKKRGRKPKPKQT